jgi:hypothetical protein
MKKKHSLFITSFALFVFCFVMVFSGNAQNHLRVNLKFGESVEIPIDEIDKITFDISTIDEELKQSIIRLISLRAAPNPADNQTNIEYKLSVEGKVALEVYNLTGVLVERHDLGAHEPGTYNFILKTNTYSSGTYVCRVSQLNQAISEKIIVKH